MQDPLFGEYAVQTPTERKERRRTVAEILGVDVNLSLHSIASLPSKCTAIVASSLRRASYHEQKSTHQSQHIALLCEQICIVARCDSMERLAQWGLATEKKAAITAAVFSSTDKIIALGLDDGTISIWNWKDHHIVREFRAHQERITGLSFSQNDQVLITASTDGLVHSWIVAEGKRLPRTAACVHSSSIRCIIYIPKKDRLFSVCNDGCAYVWKMESSWKIGVISANNQWKPGTPSNRVAWKDSVARHSGPLTFCSIANDLMTFATCSSDGTCKTWNICSFFKDEYMESSITPMKYESESQPSSDRINLALIHLGKELGSQSPTDSVLTDNPIGNGYHADPLLTMRHEGECSCSDMSLDGRLIFTGSSDSTMKIWHAESGNLVFQCNTPSPVTSLVYNSSLQILYCACDSTVLVFSISIDGYIPDSTLPESEMENKPADVHQDAYSVQRVRDDNQANGALPEYFASDGKPLPASVMRHPLGQAENGRLGNFNQDGREPTSDREDIQDSENSALAIAERKQKLLQNLQAQINARIENETATNEVDSEFIKILGIESAQKGPKTSKTAIQDDGSFAAFFGVQKIPLRPHVDSTAFGPITSKLDPKAKPEMPRKVYAQTDAQVYQKIQDDDPTTIKAKSMTEMYEVCKPPQLLKPPRRPRHAQTANTPVQDVDQLVQRMAKGHGQATDAEANSKASKQDVSVSKDIIFGNQAGNLNQVMPNNPLAIGRISSHNDTAQGFNSAPKSGRRSYPNLHQTPRGQQSELSATEGTIAKDAPRYTIIQYLKKYEQMYDALIEEQPHGNQEAGMLQGSVQQSPELRGQEPKKLIQRPDYIAPEMARPKKGQAQLAPVLQPLYDDYQKNQKTRRNIQLQQYVPVQVLQATIAKGMVSPKFIANMLQKYKDVDEAGLAQNLEYFNISPIQLMRVLATSNFKTHDVLQGLAQPKENGIALFRCLLTGKPIMGPMVDLGFKPSNVVDEQQAVADISWEELDQYLTPAAKRAHVVRTMDPFEVKAHIVKYQPAEVLRNLDDIRHGRSVPEDLVKRIYQNPQYPNLHPTQLFDDRSLAATPFIEGTANGQDYLHPIARLGYGKMGDPKDKPKLHQGHVFLPEGIFFGDSADDPNSLPYVIFSYVTPSNLLLVYMTDEEFENRYAEALQAINPEKGDLLIRGLSIENESRTEENKKGKKVMKRLSFQPFLLRQYKNPQNERDEEFSQVTLMGTKFQANTDKATPGSATKSSAWKGRQAGKQTRSIHPTPSAASQDHAGAGVTVSSATSENGQDGKSRENGVSPHSQEAIQEHLPPSIQSGEPDVGTCGGDDGRGFPSESQVSSNSEQVMSSDIVPLEDNV